ncbi:hypothetical protein [Sphingomonas vulcanisoli]|uniref:hypothetical protein n=1 Tax=Sphingomonas vulcanisoli TaxID=1658060 RepID=UPI0014248E68|nr:hypothetical protein [Sphingomonas vulcanisoli]
MIVLLALSQPKHLTASENAADATANALDQAGENLEEMANNIAKAAPDTKLVQASQAWSYDTDEDKISGDTIYYARTTSTNSVFQSSPYDSNTTMRLVVRTSKRKGLDIMFIISSGQMMCPSYEGCSAKVRFDKGPAQHVSLLGPADSSSEVVFVEGARAFLAKLKRAKHVVVEKTLYDAGNPQFEFDVSGLNWSH